MGFLSARGASVFVRTPPRRRVPVSRFAVAFNVRPEMGSSQDFNQPPTAVRPPQIIYDSEAAGRQEAVRMLVTLGTAPPWEGVDTLTQGK